tara:strand:+ start:111 stop:1574 length:1464 start_codon:yes stop_codon:yes gene_type:complete
MTINQNIKETFKEERTNIETMDKIRKLMGLKKNGNFWFTQEEMKSVISTLNPTFNLENINHKNILVKGISGWVDQQTVGTHPNIQNAKMILAALTVQATRQIAQDISETLTEIFTGDEFDLRRAIQEHNYVDPKYDPADERNQEGWEYLMDHKIQIEFHHNFNYSLMGSHTSPWYRFAQSRQGSENINDILEKYNNFYLEGTAMKRLPIGCIIDGKLFVGFGNHRARAHQLAIEKGYASNGGVLIVGSDLSDWEKAKILSDLAAMSNKRTDDEVQSEKNTDITHQVKTAFELECLKNSKAQKWTEDKKIVWGKKWVLDKKPSCRGDRKKHLVGDIVNRAFSSDRGNSLPFPSPKEINSQWQQAWPNDHWKGDKEKKIKQLECCTHPQHWQLALFREWNDDKPFNQINSKVWLTVRVGKKLDTEVTSQSRLDEDRKSFLKAVTQWNKKDKINKAGFGIVEKIQFVQQMNNDKGTAYQWNFQTETFDKV